MGHETCAARSRRGPPRETSRVHPPIPRHDEHRAVASQARVASRCAAVTGAIAVAADRTRVGRGSRNNLGTAIHSIVADFMEPTHRRARCQTRRAGDWSRDEGALAVLRSTQCEDPKEGPQPGASAIHPLDCAPEKGLRAVPTASVVSDRESHSPFVSRSGHGCVSATTTTKDRVKRMAHLDRSSEQHLKALARADRLRAEQRHVEESFGDHRNVPRGWWSWWSSDASQNGPSRVRDWAPQRDERR